MITIIMLGILLFLSILAVRWNKKKIKTPWITSDELTRLEDITKKRGEK